MLKKLFKYICSSSTGYNMPIVKKEEDKVQPAPEFSCVAKTILKDLENENPLDWKFEKKYVFYNGDSKIKYFLVWEEKYTVLINDLDFNTLTKKEQWHICNKLLEIWIFQKEVKTTKLFPNCKDKL